MPTQPVLATYTLPHPGEYSDSPVLRGTATEMANGAIHFEIIGAAALKREFELSWPALTETQKDTVETAWLALATSYASNNFTSPAGDTHTVTRHPDQESLKFESFASQGVLRYKTTLRLREV